jgi:hypothetical protein
MKFSHSFKIVTLAVTSLLATAAFAAGAAAHKGSLQVSDPVQVNGKQLKAGNYTVSWDGEGPAVNLHFMLNGKEVATAPATVVQLGQKASEDAAEVKASANDRHLSAIRFSGKKYELDIGTENSQAQGKTGDSMK